uniref:Uncharacterized protein n=1 Tax=Plectus sambesii TaxID=2011161 RepID=A0A914X5B3_9BILA
MIVLAMFVVKSSEAKQLVKYSPRWNPVFHHIRNMPSAGGRFDRRSDGPDSEEISISKELVDLEDLSENVQQIKAGSVKRQSDTFSQSTLRQLILLDRLLQNGK